MYDDDWKDSLRRLGAGGLFVALGWLVFFQMVLKFPLAGLLLGYHVSYGMVF